MYFSIKKISGHKYHYASDTIYVTRGTTTLKNKSLGRIDNPLEQRWREAAEFEGYIVREEVKARLAYWTLKIIHPKGFVYHLEKLERLRSSLHRRRESVGIVGNSGLEAAFKTDFIYNSNKLEGSKIPRATIEETIKRGDNKNKEIANSLAALAYIRDQKDFSSIRRLIKLHTALMSHEPNNLGLRKEPVVVGNFDTLPFTEIPAALRELFDWYDKANTTMYPPELAFMFYYRFERIHPFRDGNGRTGRMLMNAILKEHKYHPIIIWNRNRDAHMSAFEHAIHGQIHKYLQFMNEQMAVTYEIYLEKIQKAQDIEKNIEKTFFEIT